MSLPALLRLVFAAALLLPGAGAPAADRAAELQARFDREVDGVAKAKLLEKLGDAQLEQVHQAIAGTDYIRAGLVMEKYRDNARAALDSLERKHPDAERHPNGYKQLQIHLRKAIRDVDETLLRAPEDVQPPFQLVRKELATMNDQLLLRLFPRRPGEKPLPKTSLPEKKP